MNTVSEQPEAGRDLAAHIAEAIERDLAAHIAEAIEKERFEIAPADLYRQALEEVIRDALKVFRPQAQEAVGWPLASPEDADKGWTLDYRFIEQVYRVASQHTDYTTSMEATEQVLIAANEVLRASQPAAHPAPADEAVRRDAERYRWLRDREIPEWLDLWHQNPDRIDATIDAAMRKEARGDE